MIMHTFHIPVMGIAFTIDTPIKVAHYGISSVISIIEDSLLEKVRKTYCKQYGIPFQPVTDKDPDSRARRVTQYLNLVKQIIDKKFTQFRQSCSLDEAAGYLGMLPDQSEVKQGFSQLKAQAQDPDEIIRYAREHAKMGNIDVNIMTKLDKVNYRKGEALPKAYNDAHASLRGYAHSNLQSSVVLSAGLNPALYSYIAEFDDFYPDRSGAIKKKITLKVSDYRSALIQGKFLAKKGLWVSEFRIESGLNCGGHAFATEGHLMGPILEEFKQHRSDLRQDIFELFKTTLKANGRPVPDQIPTMKITAQGGVGTASEHNFLTDHYLLDSVGWGSPFLLVPEATCVDDPTRNLVKEATEKDLYLSKISPLGVPFHNLRANTKDQQKRVLALQGKPGSPCVKKHLSFNTEFTDKPICTASRKYQSLKIKALDESGKAGADYDKAYEEITEKACICTGLGTSFLIENQLDTKHEGDGVSICPGPNIAYFDQTVSLRQMIDHIYGRINIIRRNDRPHMFMKELGLYLDYLKSMVEELLDVPSAKMRKQVSSFIGNLENGIDYYHKMFDHIFHIPTIEAHAFAAYLKLAQAKIDAMTRQIANLQDRLTQCS